MRIVRKRKTKAQLLLLSETKVSEKTIEPDQYPELT